MWYPPRYININELLLSFQRDPDLASIPSTKLGQIMQQLYIVTGCDYISYFAGIGKATFLNIFFQHANFICGEQFQGDLSMTDHHNMKEVFLALLRLIGTAYFKKYLSTVVSRHGFQTPRHLYNSIPATLDVEQRHKEWYLQIRKVVPVLSEDQRPPTITSLWRH